MQTDRQFSHDPRTRIVDALDAVLEALRLAARELEAADDQSERWRWVALGLVSALQASLVAGLSGYVSASPEDVANPSQPERLAPVALLLRRARSAEFLNPPERLELSASQMHALEELIALRNAAVHGLGFRAPQNPVNLVEVGVGVIRQLVLTHPAFTPHDFSPFSHMIADELTRLLRISSRNQRG